MENPAEKGRAFELEVAEFLRDAGFQVALNAGAARPRQTDIYARSAEFQLLVEVKNRERKIDVSDIDALRSRLRRVPADVIGVVFSISGLTSGAIKAIEEDRTREVLAICDVEIELLRSRPIQLHSIIERKRRELREQGVAWFGPYLDLQFTNVSLPSPEVEVSTDGNHAQYFGSRSEFSHFSYALRPPDPLWIGGSQNVSLSLRLTIATIDQLRDILGYIHNHFGLTNEGEFSIQQSKVYWHGFGAEAFIDAAENWLRRYKEIELDNYHHSEDLKFFDQIGNGWLSLCLRQRIPRTSEQGDVSPYFHDGELNVELPGIPLDLSPYVELSRYTSNTWSQFRVTRNWDSYSARLRTPIPLKVVGEIIKSQNDQRERRGEINSVCGLVVQNPFYRSKTIPKELEREESGPINDIARTELMLLDLRDWHDEGDVIDEYILEGIEVVWVEGAQIIRTFGTWKNIVERVRTLDAPQSNTPNFEEIYKNLKSAD